MRKKYFWPVIIILINLVFIWGNSVFNQEHSHQISTMFRGFLSKFFDLEGGADALSDYFIRKAAHVFEYFVLGVLLTSFFGRLKLRNCLVIFFAAVPVAAIDETIQIFTGRGAAVKDVMIDVCGYALGFMIVMLIKHYIGKKDKSLNYNNKTG